MSVDCCLLESRNVLKWEAPGLARLGSSTYHHLNVGCISANKLRYFSAFSDGMALPSSDRNMSMLI